MNKKEEKLQTNETVINAQSDKTDWVQLSKNKAAIEFLEVNREEIDWDKLSKNPAAIDILKKNREEIDYASVVRNPTPPDKKTEP